MNELPHYDRRSEFYYPGIPRPADYVEYFEPMKEKTRYRRTLEAIMQGIGPLVFAWVMALFMFLGLAPILVTLWFVWR